MYDDYRIRFSRDVNGICCPFSSMIAGELFRTAYTYAGEARFCFRYIKVKLLNDEVIGRKFILFDCSGRRIVSVNE